MSGVSFGGFLSLNGTDVSSMVPSANQSFERALVNLGRGKKMRRQVLGEMTVKLEFEIEYIEGVNLHRLMLGWMTTGEDVVFVWRRKQDDLVASDDNPIFSGNIKVHTPGGAGGSYGDAIKSGNLSFMVQPGATMDYGGGNVITLE